LNTPIDDFAISRPEPRICIRVDRRNPSRSDSQTWWRTCSTRGGLCRAARRLRARSRPGRVPALTGFEPRKDFQEGNAASKSGWSRRTSRACIPGASARNQAEARSPGHLIHPAQRRAERDRNSGRANEPAFGAPWLTTASASVEERRRWSSRIRNAAVHAENRRRARQRRPRRDELLVRLRPRSAFTADTGVPELVLGAPQFRTQTSTGEFGT